MKRRLWIGLVVAAGLPAWLGAGPSLEDGFAAPPGDTKPWCYWYWISDHISKEGITKDLEAMARVGIGEALIGNIFLDDVPAGPVKVLSDEWWELVAHAMREGGRTGVNIGMFNCPGWSQSGGPWIKPGQSMRRLASAELRVQGPRALAERLPVPAEPFQQVAVLAFPVPLDDGDALAARRPRVNCDPPAAAAAALVDGDPETGCPFPAGAGRGGEVFRVEIELPEPLTARTLQITPTAAPIGAECELLAQDAGGGWRSIRRFRCDRSNMSQGVGFLPRGPVSIAFPAVTATRFRVEFRGLFGNTPAPALAEIDLTGAARLEAFVEKQLGKMHPTPLPMWDAYLWPTQPEPDDPRRAIPAAGVLDLTDKTDAGGTLRWEVPAGEWVIVRTGMTPTGMRNAPSSPEGIGLEVDKMNRGLARHHFDAFIGEVLRRVPAGERSAFTRVVADSYEMGSQNWTDGLREDFRARNGYDPLPWLPVLTGRLVGGADCSERFLWDLRRLVADRVASDYVGGLRDACRPHGLGLWLENYGHWGFPGEFLKYGAESDRIGGEYWVTGDLGSIECRAASSCANTYGKRLVSAEAFTGGPPFRNAPGALKARGDWAFCEGINHFVLHVMIQQPWDDRVPGVNAWFGTEFNRHNTWFERSKAWIDYLRRTCWMLQQGTREADVAYYIGDDAPKMTGVREPALPPGRDFDYLNGEVLAGPLAVRDGRLVLPHGTAYQVLVLPRLDTMRPAVLRKVVELVRAGATVVGTPPLRSPSMQDFPHCDDEVRALARELWGGADTGVAGERRCGAGLIVWGKPLAEVLETPPDFESSEPLRYTHRRDGGTDIYFVANPKGEPLATTAAFRAGARAPELWWPASGAIERPAVYQEGGGVVRLPLALGPHESVCVVFREPVAPAAARVVAVTRDGREVAGTTVVAQTAAAGPPGPDNFTLAAWVRPAAETTLPREADHGVVGIHDPRNDLFAAPHGDGFGGGGRAGCGLAVGTNGVCVFEHGANYFVPTLVHPARLDGWTHVTVVYQDRRPQLYLDGKPARAGLRSRHTVHSGAGAGADRQFRGRSGALREVPRALDAREVAELAAAMPRPDQAAAGPPLRLTRSGDAITATAAAGGVYQLRFADGSERVLEVAAPPPPQSLTGPWQVRFTGGRGAPERAAFDELVDWTVHPDPAIRHYSGAAVYQKSFTCEPPPGEAAGQRVVLDLGEVRDLATVRVNGAEIATLWLPPWRVDVTGALRPGANTLEVEVVNGWNNRLVGDLALPAGQRTTFLLAPTVKAGTPLQPAGLLGPVVLRFERDVPAR